jgi:hypothetical protein
MDFAASRSNPSWMGDIVLKASLVQTDPNISWHRETVFVVVLSFVRYGVAVLAIRTDMVVLQWFCRLNCSSTRTFISNHRLNLNHRLLMSQFVIPLLSSNCFIN